MTEFEKFWALQDQTHNKQFAEKVWQAAQRATIRTITSPPVIPVIGDNVKFLSLCHPGIFGKIKEVVAVNQDVLKVYWLETTDGKELTSGILGEVEVF